MIDRPTTYYGWGGQTVDADHMNGIARKLRTYVSIYTGDKEAREMADWCERVALTSAGEGDVPVGCDDGEIDPRIDAAYLAIQQKAPHLIIAGFCLSHAYEVAKAVLEANDRAAPHPTRQDGAREGEASNTLAPSPDAADLVNKLCDDCINQRFGYTESLNAVLDFIARCESKPTPSAPDEAVEAERELSQQFAETIDWIDQAGVVSDGQLETLHKACDRLNFLEATTPSAPAAT